MRYELDLTDRKILNQLDINCRQSDSEIGKKTRMSKQVVNYRIKKLLENKIITDFYPHINISKLGYGAHKIYIEFKSISKQKEEEIWNYLKKQPESIWIISCSGEWDLIFGIASRDIEELNLILERFVNRYSKFISDKSISVFNKATLHHRKWILDEKKDIFWSLGGKIEKRDITKVDLQILNLLNKNARIPIVEISEKIKKSPSLIIQRIKKLEEKEVIETFRVGLNKEKLGINYCKAFIYYQNKTAEEEDKFIEHCTSLKEILGISKSIGPWDLELEFEVFNYDLFHKILKQLKEKFSIIAKIDTCYIEKEYGSSFMPKNINN
jgi:DNA-binding Lrp family transcriptional regulator